MSFLSRLFKLPSFTSAKEIRSLVKGEHIILDVRTEMEFNQGHIVGAVNIPVHTISSFVKEIKKENKKVILYCKSGGRASRALAVLTKAKVEAYNAGGFSSLKQILG